MSKRKTEEIERLEGIGEEEVNENGLPVEENNDEEEFIGLEADEEIKGEDK